jgi:hypothetical protein
MFFSNRKSFQIGTICLLLVSCIDNKNQNEKVDLNHKAEVLKVLQYQSNAWNDGNIRGFMEGYLKSDSLQFISGRGRTLGWQKVYDNYLRHYPTKKEMGHLTFKNLICKDLSDSLMQVYGNWELERDSSVGGNFSLIMKYQDSEWKIIIDHTW